MTAPISSASGSHCLQIIENLLLVRNGHAEPSHAEFRDRLHKFPQILNQERQKHGIFPRSHITGVVQQRAKASVRWDCRSRHTLGFSRSTHAHGKVLSIPAIALARRGRRRHWRVQQGAALAQRENPSPASQSLPLARPPLFASRVPSAAAACCPTISAPLPPPLTAVDSAARSEFQFCRQLRCAPKIMDGQQYFPGNPHASTVFPGISCKRFDFQVAPRATGLFRFPSTSTIPLPPLRPIPLRRHASGKWRQNTALFGANSLSQSRAFSPLVSLANQSRRSSTVGVSRKAPEPTPEILLPVGPPLLRRCRATPVPKTLIALNTLQSIENTPCSMS